MLGSWYLFHQFPALGSGSLKKKTRLSTSWSRFYKLLLSALALKSPAPWLRLPASGSRIWGIFTGYSSGSHKKCLTALLFFYRLWLKIPVKGWLSGSRLRHPNSEFCTFRNQILLFFIIKCHIFLGCRICERDRGSWCRKSCRKIFWNIWGKV